MESETATKQPFLRITSRKIVDCPVVTRAFSLQIGNFAEQQLPFVF
ncbi:hypothetical protein SAMN03159353_104215 [Cedecea sp. NFIX57]|nr:hypothetical protein SAMN03159353_104215 [Cedecea sp. NFIX57]